MQQQIEEFLDYLASEKGYSGNTLAAYRNDLTQFALYLTNESQQAAPSSWDQVNKARVIDYILHMKELEYASSTVARESGGPQVLLPSSARRGRHRRDPTVALESPKVKKHLPKAISVDDVELLLAEPTKSNLPRRCATARCWRCCMPPACV